MSIKEEVIEALIKKCAFIFHVDESTLSAATRFIEDLDCKSVNFVQLSALLEDMYDLEVPFMEFRRKATFAEAGDYLTELVEG